MTPSPHAALGWLMVKRGPGPWRYIAADGPCWKGELGMSFWFAHIVIGWQR